MDGCASDQIGSFGLDVLWFGLDPKAVAAIDNAKVLLFGDSRMLTAASDGHRVGLVRRAPYTDCIYWPSARGSRAASPTAWWRN